ncbi:armadillo-type protein [Mycena capillaripes]|nr:armadillo-type protein [Mycena capillaripes]
MYAEKVYIYKLATLAGNGPKLLKMADLQALVILFEVIWSSNEPKWLETNFPASFFAVTVNALAQAATQVDGAQAILQAKVQDHVVELLKSPKPVVRHWTCRLVANLTWHEVTASTILGINPCVQLVRALADGALAVVQAAVQDHVLKLLESPNADIWNGACRLVVNLILYEPTASKILKINPCVQLVLLLSYEHPDVAELAIKAVANAAFWRDGAQAVIQAEVQDHVRKLLESPNPVVRQWNCWLVRNLARFQATTTTTARWLDGAQAVVQAEVQDHVLKLLESPNAVVKEWACRLAGNLALHETTASKILGINPCLQIVSLLYDEHPGVIEKAVYALSNISSQLDGAQAVIQAKVQHHVLNLFESPNVVVQEWACRLVGNIAYHEATASTIREIRPGPALVSLSQ